MPILRVGAINRRDPRGRAGVTLIEMLVVLVLVSLIAGLTYPSLGSALDSLRLAGAARGIVSFLDSGLARAERRQQTTEVVISEKDSKLWLRSAGDDSFRREMSLPRGVVISGVLPPVEQAPDDEGAPRVFFLYPGGAVPAFAIEIHNSRGVTRTVRVDPITGVPRVEAPRP